MNVAATVASVNLCAQNSSSRIRQGYCSSIEMNFWAVPTQQYLHFLYTKYIELQHGCILYREDASERVGLKNVQNISPLSYRSSHGEPCRESTFYAAIKYNALLIACKELGVKFIPLPRYHSCGDNKHGVALPRLVSLCCITSNTTDMNVAVKDRARQAAGACLVLFLVMRECVRENPRNSSMWGVGQG